MYGSPPRIDPRELRPSRGWFVAAGVIAVVFILAGIGGFAWGLVTAVREIKIDEHFGTGAAVTVRMLPEPRTGIYARQAASGATPDVECAVTSPSGQNVLVTRPGATFTTTINGVTWYEIYVVNATEAGDHQVTCESNETATFATGKHPEAAAFFGGLFGGIASLFLVPLIGLVIAGVIAAVAGVKRGNHRRRLIAERYGRP